MVYAIPLLCGLGVDQLLPLFTLPDVWRVGPAGVLVELACVLVAPAVVRFRKAEMPFDVRKAATTLVTDGPYRFTRNPGYLALTLIYLGLGFLFSSGWAVLLVPTLLIMNVAVVRKEEQHLQARFGEEYLHYRATVRRWL